jgi:hypothetical protein
MIYRTKNEISEIRDRMNAGEKSSDIYKDMDKRLEATCGIESRIVHHKKDLKKIQTIFGD